MAEPYARVLLKLSGEMFGSEGAAITPDVVGFIANQLNKIYYQVFM